MSDQKVEFLLSNVSHHYRSTEILERDLLAQLRNGYPSIGEAVPNMHLDCRK